MWALTQCPHCHGDLYLSIDWDAEGGTETSVCCLQCSRVLTEGQRVGLGIVIPKRSLN